MPRGEKLNRSFRRYIVERCNVTPRISYAGAITFIEHGRSATFIGIGEAEPRDGAPREGSASFDDGRLLFMSF